MEELAWKVNSQRCCGQRELSCDGTPYFYSHPGSPAECLSRSFLLCAILGGAFVLPFPDGNQSQEASLTDCAL